MRVSNSIPKLNLVILSLTEKERWALTKAALLAMRVQSGSYDPEEPGTDDEFTAEENEALDSAFKILNPENQSKSA